MDWNNEIDQFPMPPTVQYYKMLVGEGLWHGNFSREKKKCHQCPLLFTLRGTNTTDTRLQLLGPSLNVQDFALICITFEEKFLIFHFIQVIRLL